MIDRKKASFSDLEHANDRGTKGFLKGLKQKPLYRSRESGLDRVDVDGRKTGLVLFNDLLTRNHS